MIDFIDHKIFVNLDNSVSISLSGIINKLLEEYTSKTELHRNYLPETNRAVIPHLTRIASLLRERNIKYTVMTENRNNGVCPRNSKYIIFERIEPTKDSD